MKKKKILITGSCGFIFSNFIRNILYQKLNYNIASVDKISEPHSIKNIYSNRGHAFHIADISNAHVMKTIFELEKPDIVINGAAESKVDDSIASATPFVKSNVLGTQVIVDCCVKHNVEKLIHISTDEVYGQLTSENDSPWDESCAINPRNPYAATKAASELIVQAAHTTHGLNYIITRSCNNFGPRQSTKNLIPKIIKNILEKKPVPIWGNGSQLREWIHVFDNCSAIIFIMENSSPNHIYNISAGCEFSNLEVFNEICNIMGGGYSLLQFTPDPRPGHDFRYSINSAKLKNIGWKPKLKFKNGLKQCVEWYMSNQWFLTNNI